MTSPWYSNASSLENNNKLYKEKSQLIDKLLYEDLPETIVVVDYVNEEKKILNFLLNRYYRGFFNYSQFDVNPKVGQVYKVKMKSEGDEGYHNVYSMSEKDNERASDLFYNFIGNISIHKGNSFGIIDGKQSVFVTGHQIKKYQLSDGDTVNGLAIANYDKKKKVWGWRLINVNE